MHALKKALPGLIALTLMAQAPSWAGDPSVEALPPKTDTSSLPPIPDGWAELNPYRGNSAVVATGRALYNESCAVCHGPDLNHRNQVGPNLLRLQRGCQKVADAALHQRCMADVDHYFVKSVRRGKRVLDVQHMPPWDGVLTPQAVWAIRSFIESRIDEQARLKLGEARQAP
ncbi:c-type cytochrome [Methyloversatilis universalis]|uniref:c-type cytochrome n=1 Tax=Methyloversatilis universalis TaxID=378211 RepID=UPI00036D988C|nr:c-type cytochrome [Methyloversatilis universalis]